jgi:hypothetical protein
MDLQSINWNLVWVGWLALFGLFEGLALADKKHDGDTLSERTRDWFRTEKSQTGRRVFAAGWVTFAAWFLVHILWPELLS